MGPELGAFENHDNIDMLDAKMLSGEQLLDVFQEQEAVSAFPLGFVVGKMGADVAEAGGSEQRVAQCMRDHIAIGMADGPFIEGHLDAADDKFAAFAEAVQVVANAATKDHAFFCSAWR